MLRLLSFGVVSLVCLAPVRADGPADNVPDNVRRIPRLGIEVPEADAKELQAGLTVFEERLAKLRAPLEDAAAESRRKELLPDVEVYYKAVHDALAYREFFDAKELPVARELLAEGLERADQLLTGTSPWTLRKGLVVRGYRSKIDGSVQPYGLVIPDSYNLDGGEPVRLDIWFHGRGETLSELNFVQQRRKQVGQISPKNTIVLHPYGRYCNANKFAGEIDTLEALESVQRRYRIDEDRTSVRGFSMGGAACWQFAVHYADRWAAAAPGAGFSETPDFLRVFQNETLAPPWYEEKLWRWYDCTDWAANLAQLPTVAYSGELDTQKQAADVMQTALEKEGISLVHLIGPGTKHAYHPEAAAEIERRISSIVQKGRDRIPQRVRFTTYTLRYNRMAWVTVDSLAEHWEPARVNARYVTERNAVVLKTSNVTGLTLRFPSGWCPFDVKDLVNVEIDGQIVPTSPPASDRSWESRWSRPADRRFWKPEAESDTTLRKRHGLQGPIDDAFLDTFLFVKPTTAGANEKVHLWAAAEFSRAVEHWRRQFRGEAPVKADTEVTDADIASANLVLWGDPASNAVLAKIADKLPIRWDKSSVRVGEREYAAEHHAPVLIYPNPLNPKRYVVLNSGFTYRDYDYLNNARQTPKLPDWAIVDVTTPPGSQWPGKIVAADFFGENWELRKK